MVIYVYISYIPPVRDVHSGDAIHRKIERPQEITIFGIVRTKPCVCPCNRSENIFVIWVWDILKLNNQLMLIIVQVYTMGLINYDNLL